MNKTLSKFLQIIVVLIGANALFLLLYMPSIEGVNANATNLSQIYFDDPFLAFVYIGSIAFFVGVYKVFKVLEYAGQNQLSSPATLRALKTIKYCALIIIGFVIVGEVWILNTVSDDHAGGIAMGVFITVGSLIVIAISSWLHRRFQKNLTV